MSPITTVLRWNIPAITILVFVLGMTTSCQDHNSQDYKEDLLTSIALSPEYDTYRKAFEELKGVDADMQAIADVRKTEKYDENSPLPHHVLKDIEGGVAFQAKQDAWDEAYKNLNHQYPYATLSKADKDAVKSTYHSEVRNRPVILPPTLNNK